MGPVEISLAAVGLWVVVSFAAVALKRYLWPSPPTQEFEVEIRNHGRARFEILPSDSSETAQKKVDAAMISALNSRPSAGFGHPGHA